MIILPLKVRSLAFVVIITIIRLYRMDFRAATEIQCKLNRNCSDTKHGPKATHISTARGPYGEKCQRSMCSGCVDFLLVARVRMRRRSGVIDFN